MRQALLLALLMGCGTAKQEPDGGCEARSLHFDRACATEADCALLNHRLDCCGSEAALGISANGWAGAQRLELACISSGPVCRCIAKQTVADDGKSFPEAASLKLRCVAGRCESFVN